MVMFNSKLLVITRGYMAEYDHSEMILTEFAVDLLGGELPTNRFCGLVHPSDFRGLTLPKSHL